MKLNTSRYRVGSDFRDQTLSVKSRKTTKKSFFFVKKFKLPKQKYIFFCIYLLSMPKILGGNKFSRTGDSPKWVKGKRRKREKDRKLVIIMASYAL